MCVIICLYVYHLSWISVTPIRLHFLLLTQLGMTHLRGISSTVSTTTLAVTTDSRDCKGQGYQPA